MTRGVAQLAECALWEREVPSSTLGTPTRQDEQKLDFL